MSPCGLSKAPEVMDSRPQRRRTSMAEEVAVTLRKAWCRLLVSARDPTCVLAMAGPTLGGRSGRPAGATTRQGGHQAILLCLSLLVRVSGDVEPLPPPDLSPCSLEWESKHVISVSTAIQDWLASTKEKGRRKH
ncbi:uncharacterized protein [Miscanthus floridulus]|uniref:uncharacterized protein isoform X2 n=1 Tax=Miscanthus floridulus TaxID=154761 RepID=UPI00345827CC